MRASCKSTPFVHVLVVAVGLLVVSPAAAQEPEPTPDKIAPVPIALTAAALRGDLPLANRGTGEPGNPEPGTQETGRARQIAVPRRPPVFTAPVVDLPKRPAALMPLYGSLIALQGLDIHSTRTAIDSGGSEANPAIRPFVKNSAAFIAVKAGATAGVIWASEKLWKKNRKAAVVFATVVNVAMAAVVANNYRVSR